MFEKPLNDSKYDAMDSPIVLGAIEVVNLSKNDAPSTLIDLILNT